MPLIVNVSKASFTISGPEYEPTGAEALRNEQDRRYWWKIFGEWCLRAKRKELFKGEDRQAKPFKPIRYKRPDGAKGPPLSPHQRASRFQKWARVVATSRQVTLFWSHGWAKVVGAHAFPRMRAAGWKLPKRDAVGLSPGSLRWAFGMTLQAWRHRLGTVATLAVPADEQGARGGVAVGSGPNSPVGGVRAARRAPGARGLDVIAGARPPRRSAITRNVRVFTGTDRPRLGKGS